MSRLLDMLGIGRGVCVFDDCSQQATTVVYDKEKEQLVLCCADHYGDIADKHTPEYIEHCPNCGCVFGSNGNRG